MVVALLVGVMNGVVVVGVQDRLADRHAGHRVPHPSPRAVANGEPDRHRPRAPGLVPGHRPEPVAAGTSRCPCSTRSSWRLASGTCRTTRRPGDASTPPASTRTPPGWRRCAPTGSSSAACSRRPRWPASPASCWPRTSGRASPTAGNSYLLPAFAAVFLGATQLKNGRFNAWGTIIAVILLGTLTTGLGLARCAQWVQQFATGVVLIGALALTGFQVRRAGSESRRARGPPQVLRESRWGERARGRDRASRPDHRSDRNTKRKAADMHNLTRTGRRRRKLLLPAILVAGALIAASCGDDDDSSSGATTTAAAAERPPPPPRRSHHDRRRRRERPTTRGTPAAAPKGRPEPRRSSTSSSSGRRASVSTRRSAPRSRPGRRSTSSAAASTCARPRPTWPPRPPRSSAGRSPSSAPTARRRPCRTPGSRSSGRSRTA